MHIQILPGDFIINPYSDMMGTRQSDFALKAIRFQNDGGKPVCITGLCFRLEAGGKPVKEIIYSGEALDARLRDGWGRISPGHVWGIKSMIGSSLSWDLGRLTGTRELPPGEEAALVNEFFLAVSRLAVDSLTVETIWLEGGLEKREQVTIPVIFYRTKNAYTFPVRGVWQVNGNYDCLCAHRTQYSMEFAIDLGQLYPDGMFAPKADMRDEDYIAFGKEVLAIGDGVVTDCFNQADWRVNFPADDATEEEKCRRDAVQAQYGRLPIQCGNYVVIRHGHGEHSVCGHMIKGSVAVHKGDRVRGGDVLGRIGNTGISGCPHLHFHLMDGPDFYSARGLPCHFTNLTDCSGHPLELIQEEYTIVRAQPPEGRET